MFEEVLGLYLHPLAIHAPIVLVPLLVLAVLLYALVPKIRRHVTWVTVFLAVVTPLSALLAKLSGEALAEARYGSPLPDSIVSHSHWGDRLVWSSAALGVVTLALAYLRRGDGGSRPKALAVWALTVLVIVAAGLSAWFVFMAGHSGSSFNWEVPS